MDFSPVIGFGVFCGIGKLLMYLFRKFPLSALMRKNKYTEQLLNCDLCLGVWTYFFLALILKFRWSEIPYPVLSEFFVGCMTSFISFVFSAGWSSLYQSYEVA
jgi:hypothetical protein